MKWLLCAMLLCVSSMALCQTAGNASAQTRFYKEEYGTGAGYLKLSKDGTYEVVAREHMGVMVIERGRWQQDGALINFRPSRDLHGRNATSVARKTYEGTEVTHKGRVFIAFNNEEAPGLVIPVHETKNELDTNPKNIPWYVFFKTTEKVYARETKLLYPFRYVKPACPRRDSSSAPRR